MDFLGGKSKTYVNKFNAEDQKNGSFCTMPVKFTFESGAARVNFERTLKSQCGLNAKMSLPPVLRQEMQAFTTALKKKYPGKVITVRTDKRSQTFRGLMKNDKEKSWTECPEVHKISPSIMLPGYKPSEIDLEETMSPTQIIIDPPSQQI
jgi:hypothetical protein